MKIGDLTHNQNFWSRDQVLEREKTKFSNKNTVVFCCRRYRKSLGDLVGLMDHQGFAAFIYEPELVDEIIEQLGEIPSYLITPSEFRNIVSMHNI